MGRVAVVTDSTADFAGVDIMSHPITIVPLSVHWGRDVLRDRIDISTEEFYTRLRTDRELPRTAAPPLGIFEEVYRNLLTVHEAVISVHLASELSATHGVAQSAAGMINRSRVHVVDSTTISVGLGWLAHRAAALADDGATADAILQSVAEMIPRIRLYFALDTLDFLQRGGRIGRAQAFLGGVLNVKPILRVQDGIIHPVERVRTRAASIRRLAEIAQEAGAKELLAVAHGDAERDCFALREEVQRREGRVAIPAAEVGAVIGTHAGPGLLGVGFLLAR